MVEITCRNLNLLCQKRYTSVATWLQSGAPAHHLAGDRDRRLQAFDSEGAGTERETDDDSEQGGERHRNDPQTDGAVSDEAGRSQERVRDVHTHAA